MVDDSATVVVDRPTKRSSGASAASGDEAPLTPGEAQLLGEVYASLHARLVRHREDPELQELGRAVYAGAANSRSVLRAANLPRLRAWLITMRGELIATGHFAEASHVKDLVAVLQTWERRTQERADRR